MAQCHRRRRVVFAGLLGLVAVLTLVLAVPAFADDGDPPQAAEAQEESGGLDISVLEKRLRDNPKTGLLIILLRFGPLLPGAILATLWFLKRDKIKGGMLPPLPEVRTTQPFTGTSAIALLLLAFVGIPFVALMLLPPVLGVSDGNALPMWVKVAVSAAGSIPVAILIVMRRRRMAAHRPEPQVMTAGYWAPPVGGEGTPMPSVGRAFGFGWWGLCIASVFVIPVSYAWIALLTQFDVSLDAQGPVQEVITATSDATPWIVAVFGVLVAPFVEESIFRGMLYPAVKRTLGGTRRAAWSSAVIVSLLFAAIHGNWMALLPLFALAMVLAWVFEATNSLAAVVFTHALYNLFSLVPLMMLRYST